jgi:hypothetical protein
MEETTAALDIRAINEKIERESAFIDLLNLEMNKVIVGQKHMIERLLIGLLGQAIFFSKACRDSQKPRHQYTFASRSRIIQPHSVYP